MGELFTNVNEFLPLVSQRLIDFIRIHVSDLGGITVRSTVCSKGIDCTTVLSID